MVYVPPNPPSIPGADRGINPPTKKPMPGGIVLPKTGGINPPPNTTYPTRKPMPMNTASTVGNKGKFNMNKRMNFGQAKKMNYAAAARRKLGMKNA